MASLTREQVAWGKMSYGNDCVVPTTHVKMVMKRGNKYRYRGREGKAGAAEAKRV